MNAPAVSVVVSHYDRRAWLREALESVAAQTFRDFEILVVSDAGPDHSSDAAEFGARWIARRVNGGVAATRNTGVAEARGALVAHLDDDDLWRREHLALLCAALTSAADAGLAYGDAEVWRVEPAARPRDAHVAARLTLAVPFAWEDLARDDFIVPGATLYRRTLHETVGPFDESLFVSDDWDWLLRAARATRFVRVPHVVTTVRIRTDGGNLSADAGARRRAALDTIERRHGTPHLEPKTFWEVAETYASRGGATR